MFDNNKFYVNSENDYNYNYDLCSYIYYVVYLISKGY